MTKNFFLYLWPSLVQTIGGIAVVIPITTYYLDPADFGLMAILTAITMPIGPLSSAGDSWVLSGNWFRTNERERGELLFNLLIANMGLKLVWVVVFWMAAPVLLPLLVKDYSPSYESYFALVLGGLLLNTIWTTVSHVMVLEEAAAINAMVEIVQWLAGTLTVLIALAVFKLGVVALFLSPIAAGLASTTFALRHVWHRLGMSFSKEWMKEIMKRGMPAMPLSLVDVVVNSMDRVLIQRWLDLSALGIYAHAQSYRGIFVTTTRAYSKAMTPLFLELFSGATPEKEGRVVSRVAMWYACAAAGGILVALFCPEFIHLLTHGKFDVAATLVPIWFLLVLTHSAAIPYTQFVLYARRNNLLAASSTAVSLLTIVLMVFLTKIFGILGATWAAVLGSLGLQGARLFLARKLGCTSNLDKGIVWAFAAILATYMVTTLLPITLAGKLMIASFVILGLGISFARLFRFSGLLSCPP